MSKIIFFLISLSFASSLFAATAGCTGNYRGMALEFYAQGDVFNRNNGFGWVKVNGRKVADFDGEQSSVDFLRQRFSARNNRGDVVEGQLTNLGRRTGTLVLLRLPGERINLRNIPVSCWIR
jgi:hypothetical protein